MLIELHIRDFAVIDELHLELGPGLTVLSGETGAGKSIIIGALSLLLGERASPGVVRTGADHARVEAVFDVSGLKAVLERMDELGIAAEDDLLILRREVAAQGRNRAWVNGSPTTAAVVGELGGMVADLHGQHEHQRLLVPTEQRRFLDAYAGVESETQEVRGLHAEVRALRAERDSMTERARELASRADFLRFQHQEIADADPQIGEEEALDIESSRLQHAQELASETHALHEELYAAESSLADRLAEARRLLEALARIDPTLRSAQEGVESAYHQISEIGRTLGDYSGRVEHDPERLEAVRSRRDLLARLRRKYGPELSDVLTTAERVRQELDELESGDIEMGDLSRRIDEREARLSLVAQKLTRARDRAARGLSRDVQAVLPALGLAGAVFQILLVRLPEVGAGGAETVEFRASLNPGFEPDKMAAIASGGELSRVMLALKSILAEVDPVPTLVFDEIDAGVGGVVATAVAEQLRRVAEGHQVFVITHLPQVAARAGHHLRVSKGDRGGIASTDVQVLTEGERVMEVARMLGGDPDSEVSRAHARELLGVGSGGTSAPVSSP